EWLPELAYILRGDEARPITRLIHGTRYALGILARTRSITGQLRRSVPVQPQAIASHLALQRVQVLSWMMYDARRTGTPVSSALRGQALAQLGEDMAALAQNDADWMALGKFFDDHRLVKCLLAELEEAGHLPRRVPWHRVMGDLLMLSGRPFARAT